MLRSDVEQMLIAVNWPKNSSHSIIFTDLIPWSGLTSSQLVLGRSLRRPFTVTPDAWTEQTVCCWPASRLCSCCSPDNRPRWQTQALASCCNWTPCVTDAPPVNAWYFVAASLVVCQFMSSIRNTSVWTVNASIVRIYHNEKSIGCLCSNDGDTFIRRIIFKNIYIRKLHLFGTFIRKRNIRCSK